MQNLPLHYFLALRADFIREKMAEKRAIAKASGEDVIEFDAKAAKSGDLATTVNESMDRQPV